MNTRFFFSRSQVAAAVAVSALVLAGCGSSVKLEDQAPVSDRTGQNGNGTAGSGTGGASSVVPVTADSELLGQAPKNVARVVYFDFDDFTVRPEFTPLIETHARFLKANQARRVVLEGNTDERGGREYNLALGQKRAEAVRRNLSLLGVTEAQMESVSFGEEKPAQPGSTEEAYRLNRRVELSYR